MTYPSKPISLKAYCPVKRPLDVKGLILEAVRYEDRINHLDDPDPEIPELEYPKAEKHQPVGAYVFIKNVINGYLP